VDDNSNATDKYLIYQLGDQFFATPLIEIREVIEYREPKQVPHTARFFKGVINIRGEIVGVIDLRERLGMIPELNPVAQLVFETDKGPLAAIVDRVQSVTVINESEIDRRAVNQNATYFTGVGKIEDYLISILSLKNVVTSQDLTGLPG